MGFYLDEDKYTSKMNTSREYIVELILSLEKKIVPEKWVLNGVNIWPWVRAKLFFYLIKKIERTDLNASNTRLFSYFERYKRIFASLLEWRKFNTIGKSKVLFVSASELRGQFEGISYNKFFDSLRSSDEFKTSILIETSDLPSNAFLRENSLSFSRLQTIFRFLSFFYKSKKNAPFWNDLNSALKVNWPTQEGRSDSFDVDSFVSSLVVDWHKILTYKRIWKWILARITPRKIFTLWYYSDSIYSLNLAAAERGITTVETQHGPINSFHLAYGSFEHFNSLVLQSSLLPQAFLVWNKNTYNTLVHSFGSKRVDILGMPWFDFILRKSKHMNYKKKFILYALQPAKEIGPLFPQTLVKMMSDSSEEFDWFIRLHPRQMMEYDAIKTELEGYRLPNVEIDIATRTPLPIVLNACSMVFTNFSGVALEAIQIGKPVITINAIAKLYYLQEVNDHLVFACDLKHDMLSWSQLKKETEGYFNTVNESRINSLEMFKAYCAN